MVYIAGIDIGTTTAIVLIDENGNIVEKISSKNFSEIDIIKYLIEKKHVVLLATDKAKIPDKIKKISARLNIGIYAPSRDIPLDYKEKFYRDSELKNKLNNMHEMDAYIAAKYAYENIKDIIKKASKISKDEDEKTKILRLVFKEKKIDPKTAYEILHKIEEQSEKEIINKNKRGIKIKRNKRRYFDYILNITIKRKDLEEKIENLKKELIEKSKKISEYSEIIKILSKCILDNDFRNIIPKYSFVKQEKTHSERIFLDTLPDSYIYDYKEIYIPENLINNAKSYIKNGKIYIVKKYKDLKTFVKLEEVIELKEDKQDLKENIELLKKKIEEIIRKYRYK